MTTIVINSGNGQSAPDNAQFALPFTCTVDNQGVGVSPVGQVLTFAAPSSGASCKWGNNSIIRSYVITGISGANTGTAVSDKPTANATTGSYSVGITYVPGLGGGNSAQIFGTLTNQANQIATTLIIAGGNGQSAGIGTTFANPIIAQLKDQFGNPIANASITFTLGTQAGATGRFPGNAITAVALTNASGFATSPLITAYGSTGAWSGQADTSGGVNPAVFTLTNTTYVPVVGAVVVYSGTDQSTATNTPFALPLSVYVTDQNHAPMAGVTVTFTPPQGSPSCSFPVALWSTGVTGSNGIATSPTPVADNSAGNYVVTASAGTQSCTFNLANVFVVGPPQASSLTLTGNGQSAQFSTAFAAPLTVQVRDQFGNIMVGQNVVFTGPASGPACVFTNASNTITIPTDGTGTASTGVITANSQQGSYIVNCVAGAVSVEATLNNGGTAVMYGFRTYGGNGQTAAINTIFSRPLSALATDQYGNGFPGVQVNFVANPVGGASCTITGANPVTNAQGVATTGNVTANSTSGSYTVTATGIPVGSSLPVDTSITSYGGAVISEGAGWSNGQGAYSQDPFNKAQFFGPPPAFTSAPLVIGGFALSAIPDNAIINGIAISLFASATVNDDAGGGCEAQVTLTAGGSGPSTTVTTSVPIQGSTFVFGNSTYLWGQSWTAAQVKAMWVNYAMKYYASSSGTGTEAQVSQMRGTIYYTIPGSGSTFTATFNLSNAPGGTMQNQQIGTTVPSAIGWTNPANIFSTSVNATYTQPGVDGSTTNILRMSGFNFSAIPVNATIVGITAIAGAQTYGDVTAGGLLYVRLYEGVTATFYQTPTPQSGTDPANLLYFPGPLATYPNGNDWGKPGGWTRAEILVMESAIFGSMPTSGGNSAFNFAARNAAIRVWYTVPVPGTADESTLLWADA